MLRAGTRSTRKSASTETASGFPPPSHRDESEERYDLETGTVVPPLQLLLASDRLLKGAVVADLHVELTVAVSDRRQNVAAVQVFRPDFMF